MPANHALAVIACFVISFGAAAPLHAQVERFGKPCSSPGAGGSGGRIPRLTVDDAAILPSPNGFSLEVETGVANSTVFLIFGLKNTSWAGGPLPQDLSVLGLGGCQLLVSMDAMFGFGTGANGRLSIPFSTSGLAVGQKGYVQAFANAKNSKGQPIYGISDGLMLEVVAPLPNHTIAMLPDTQIYTITATLFQTFLAQTNWIIQQLAARNIVFVSHVGDLVQNGAVGANKNQTEWDRANLAMQTLDGDLKTNKDGLVPYGAVLGNRDLDVIDNLSAATQYVSHFGPGRYQGRKWYLGADSNGRNHAQKFTVAGRDYLHLSIEWHPSDSAIQWAQSQLAAHPYLPTIVTTHEYVVGGDPAPRSPAGHTATSGGANSGEDIYRKLIETSPQVFLVLCGHLAGEGKNQSTTVLGRNVHEMLANYQWDPNGGNGWLRTLDIQPTQNRIRVKTMSPVYVSGVTNGRDYSNMASSNFDLAYDASEHRAYLGAHRIQRFRQGQDFGQGVYSGTQDTTLSAGAPNQNGGNLVDITCDGDGNKEQGMLRFDAIVGSGAGQIPPGTRVVRAVLTLTTEGTGAESASGGKLYQLTTTWSEASTYSSLIGGIQVGQETVATADVDTMSAVTTTGTRSFDVTAAVQAWVDSKSPNLGWAIIANGSDAWSFRSSEWGTVAERPQLTIVY